MEFIDTIFAEITLKQVFDFIVGAIAVISIFVEFSKKIHFRPWSFVFSHIEGLLNRNLLKKLDEIEKQQRANEEAIIELKKDIEKKFEESAVAADTKEAKRLRSRIIEFTDSCRIHQKHTKTAFENITRDYDDYLNYCEEHDIPNHFIDAEFEYIKEVYAECQAENKFI